MQVCVYCSSTDGLAHSLVDQARRMGAHIGQRGDGLVWGGGRVGLMGEVARACRAAGGTTFGVIPESMKDVEVADYDADELIITDTMRERKQLMDEKADAFVILPGGFGTLEELAEVLVLSILSYHERPIVIVNAAVHEGAANGSSNGSSNDTPHEEPTRFYTPMIALFDHFVATGVAKAHYRDLFKVVDDVDEVYAAFA